MYVPCRVPCRGKNGTPGKNQMPFRLKPYWFVLTIPSFIRAPVSVEDQREHDEEEGGGGAQQEEADRDTDVEAGGGEGDEEEGGNDGGRITNALDLMETLVINKYNK